MRKAHYQTIARILREAYRKQSNGENAIACLDFITSKLGEFLKKENPRFDPIRFYNATDPERGKGEA